MTEGFKGFVPVVIDFETFMDPATRYSLKFLSDIQYILDPRFEVLSIAIGHKSKTKVYPGDSKEWIKELERLNDEHHIFIAHNARFDFRILKLKYGFQPRCMGDTMLMARYLGFPKCDLASLALRRLNLKKLENPTAGKRLAQHTLEDWTMLAGYNSNDVVLTNKLYFHFVEHFPERELRLIDQTLRLCLKENQIDWAAYEQLLTNLKESFRSSEEKKPELVKNRDRSAFIRNLIKQQSGVDPGSIDKKKVILSNLPPGARATIENLWDIKSVSKNISDLEALRSRSIDPRTDKALIDLNYSKAVTHRWSGGGDGGRSFNIQTMSKDIGLREVWVPDMGCVYVVVDLSQIEARICAWLAGEEGMLRSFAEGRDIYCEFGENIFGHVLIKSKEPEERSVCKAGILGLGFGMGAPKFHERLMVEAHSALEATKKSLNLFSTMAVADTVVRIHRATYPKLAGMPKAVYQCICDIVSQNETAHFVFDQGRGKFYVSYYTDKKVITIKLPTGSQIIYRDIVVGVQPSRFGNGRLDTIVGYTFGGGPITITYSSPFENVVQSIARDIMADMLLKAEGMGFDLRMHSHDEAVFNVPRADAIKLLKRVKELFSVPPDCCLDLPLACEAHLSDRYTKDDKYMTDFEKRFYNELIEPKEFRS